MMTRFLKLLLLSFLGSLVVAGSAMALPMQLTLDDGTVTPLVVTDGGAEDTSALAGVLNVNQAYGNWTVNIVTGISEPVIGSLTRPELDLNSVNVTGAAGTLNITLWDDYAKLSDLESVANQLNFDVGGTSGGSIKFEVDINGTTFSTPIFGSGAFAFTKLGTAVTGDPNVEVQMSIKAVITHARAGQVTSFDAHINTIPEPTTLILFGFGLLGVARISRRRQD